MSLSAPAVVAVGVFVLVLAGGLAALGLLALRDRWREQGYDEGRGRLREAVRRAEERGRQEREWELRQELADEEARLFFMQARREDEQEKRDDRRHDDVEWTKDDDLDRLFGRGRRGPRA